MEHNVSIIVTALFKMFPKNGVKLLLPQFEGYLFTSLNKVDILFIFLLKTSELTTFLIFLVEFQNIQLKRIYTYLRLGRLYENLERQL